jgi:hypothetical protein
LPKVSTTRGRRSTDPVCDPIDTVSHSTHRHAAPIEAAYRFGCPSREAERDAAATAGNSITYAHPMRTPAGLPALRGHSYTRTQPSFNRAASDKVSADCLIVQQRPIQRVVTANNGPVRHRPLAGDTSHAPPDDDFERPAFDD